MTIAAETQNLLLPERRRLCLARTAAEVAAQGSAGVWQVVQRMGEISEWSRKIGDIRAVADISSKPISWLERCGFTSARVRRFL